MTTTMERPVGSQAEKSEYGAPEQVHWAIAGQPDEGLLLRAADRLAPLDAELARDVYLEALGSAICTSHPEGDSDTLAAAVAASRLPRSSQPPRPADLLLDGLVARFTDGYASSLPGLRRALQAFGETGDAPESRRWLWLVFRIATDLWEEQPWHNVVSGLERFPLPPNPASGVHELDRISGPREMTRAANGLTQKAAETVRVGPNVYDPGLVEVLALVGSPVTQSLTGLSPYESTFRSEARSIFMSEYSRAVLSNGLGRYESALVAAQRSCRQVDLGLHGWALSELVEAATRTGNRRTATDALRRLSERTQASATEWALGVEARSRALVSNGRAAESLYREAVERLGCTRIDVHLARSHLLYGEWLRRSNRRVDAREQLRRAHAIYDATGAEAFAERARRELLATGETVRKRSVDAQWELTAQEQQIARLAGSRPTNSEIATQLFISPRTVEWHLRKVFAKPGVSSRRELSVSS
jgi:DNA-binding CsgD family transcriptional regulator